MGNGERDVQNKGRSKEDLAQYAWKKGESGQWAKGSSGNPGAFSKAGREVRELCKKLLPAAIARLGEISVGDDAPAAVAATKVLLVRGIGKEREAEALQKGSQNGARVGDAIDLQLLSDDQLDRIHKVILENAV